MDCNCMASFRLASRRWEFAWHFFWNYKKCMDFCTDCNFLKSCLAHEKIMYYEVQSRCFILQIFFVPGNQSRARSLMICWIYELAISTASSALPWETDSKGYMIGLFGTSILMCSYHFSLSVYILLSQTSLASLSVYNFILLLPLEGLGILTNLGIWNWIP